MRNTIGRAVYSVIDLASGQGIRPRLRSLLESQYWDPADLGDLQRGKLRRLLSHAQRNVPYYSDYRDRFGVDLSAVREPEDLKEIPVLTREDITGAGEGILDARPADRFCWDVTSGSTGSPLSFRKSLDACGWHRATHLRSLRWYGVHAGDRQARVWGVPIRSVDRIRERIKDFFLNRKRLSSFDLNTSDLDEIVRKLDRWKPTYIFGYASAIHSLAAYISAAFPERTPDWKPRIVVTTSEMLFPFQKDDITSTFGCPILNEYGASELTILASTCPEGSHHINDESVITEYLPTDLVIDGKPAYRLVFTDLNNHSMPLIRYQLGDLGRPVDEPCRCGRGLTRIELLGGREVDVLVTPSGRKIHGSVFSYLGKSVLIRNGVHKFRATQSRADLLEIEIVPGEGFNPACYEMMRREISRRAGDDVEVAFHEVADIPPEPSGKLRYFIGRMPADS